MDTSRLAGAAAESNALSAGGTIASGLAETRDARAAAKSFSPKVTAAGSLVTGGLAAVEQFETDLPRAE